MFLLPLAFVLSSAISAHAQQPAAPSAEALSAIVARGLEPDATAQEWRRLHDAVDGLIALAIGEGDYLKAAFHAGMQAHYYQTLERDDSRALTAAERALTLKREVPGQPQIAIEHGAIGRLLLALGRPEAAAGQFREARDRGDERASRYWRDLVGALLAAGALADAREEAQGLAKAAPGLDAALAIAATAAAAGDFDAALAQLQRARTLTLDMPARGFEVTASLAALLLDATRALPYETALALAERVSRDFPELPIDLRPVARAAASLRRRLAGDFDAVIRELGDAIEGARREGRLTGEIQASRELAAVYASLNAWPEAAALTEDVRRLIVQAAAAGTGLPADLALETDVALGHAAIELGDLDRARRAFDAAAATFEATAAAGAQRELSAAYGEAVLGQARIASLDGKPAEAAAILTRALDGQPGAASFDRADVLARLARIERAIDPAAASARFDQSIRAYEERGDRGSALSVRLQLIEHLSAHTSTLVDGAAIARGHIDDATREAARFGDTGARWRLLRADGVIAEAMGDSGAAMARYEASIAALEEQRTRLSAGDDRAALLDADAAQDVYRRLASIHLAGGRTAAAWRIVERAKARAFVEMLAGRGSAAVAAGGEELRRLEDEIAGLRVLMSPGFEGLQRGAGREPAALRGQLDDLERRYSIERRRASARSPRATAMLAIDPITLEETRRHLPEGSALIEYAVMPDGLAAFIVSASAVDTVRWTVEWSDLRARVTTLRERLADLMATGSLQDAANDVAARALPPELLAKLPATVNRLLLVPADVLLYVPFDVLPLPGGGQVIDRFTVSYLPSASALQYLGGAAASGDGSLFLGALGEARVEDWSPLPGTLTETSAILAEYPTATRVVEQAFTQQAAIDAITRYDRVHFATHGILNAAAPMFSAVLMGTPEGNTRLSLYQIAALPVRARLVVLSACETGLGRLQRGDEITGLTRTFLQAGASSVVSSLWSVADDSTAFLMARFYRELGRGETPASALRAAALAARAEYGHPFFWAPFTLTGVQ